MCPLVLLAEKGPLRPGWLERRVASQRRGKVWEDKKEERHLRGPELQASASSLTVTWVSEEKESDRERKPPPRTRSSILKFQGSWTRGRRWEPLNPGIFFRDDPRSHRGPGYPDGPALLEGQPNASSGPVHWVRTLRPQQRPAIILPYLMMKV